ncbi:MAG: methylenetetrahydrofolate--tRNA-(uracil(54)-C(5))-methyltransferase (FADH(2)-oxidizing) TrmFO [Candidatus Coatesbacteria bacterium]|nr:methylenetetrahydrofolate--tRNA-(uracil(54)-C(5))-methyltransferase (FADH(2)-oxidizing) TrmFO [Candidatus Coatesbacteria bacterium]
MGESEPIVVVGAGLAGSEAAWQIARMGHGVRLYEMRPQKPTPAHQTGLFAELVCSNSLKSDEPDSPQGLLKAELRGLGSLVLSVADAHRVPAGKALAVDRYALASAVTEVIEASPLIDVVRGELAQIDTTTRTVVATGPLTSNALSESLASIIGSRHLYFFDAISPTVEADSVDLSRSFWGARYLPDRDDYLNCPLSEEEYSAFRNALLGAEMAEPHDFERRFLFEGCLPVEEMARRGEMTLAFGPLKPVGLVDPKTGKRPFACLQLRRENKAGTLLSLVACQTRLKHSEQRRVFGLIPALRNASFARYGAMHRNMFVNAPSVLTDCHQLKTAPDVFLAGQITGVEGYVESIASGLITGVNAARIALGLEPALPPSNTMVGAIMRYPTSADPEHFQPMNANFGIIASDPAVRRMRRRLRKAAIAEVALASLQEWGSKIEPFMQGQSSSA